MLRGVAYGFGIGILLALALYFFWHLPAVDKAYKKGLSECKGVPDTTYLPGKISIVYREILVYPDEPIQHYDSAEGKYYQTKTFVSGASDSITIRTASKDPDVFIEMLKFIKAETISKPDTIKITYPMKEVECQGYTNWEVQAFSFILGAVVLFLSVLGVSMFIN